MITAHNNKAQVSDLGGSWTAGIALASTLRQAGPPLIGTVAVALIFVPLTALTLLRATRSEAPAPKPAPAAGQAVDSSTQGTTNKPQANDLGFQSWSG
ncbi:hypothetical protein H1V43_06375 [Streptomyces sp. PSKA54]|uniref:Uncharacterized protein n=1 Tax=Streptomyces himalayensis subsp. aureolus TaxID=2758039 RepID=A0A7W2CXZ2_9ACTN|nr:hypothetical protein [Streptomyces himalayensis]MBA4861011.1 hypothetical protein [Streptomyces himalayensis subsp. aureolus]